jgi:hypothetical protein
MNEVERVKKCGPGSNKEVTIFNLDPVNLMLKKREKVRKTSSDD